MNFTCLDISQMKVFVVEDSAVVRERLVEQLQDIDGIDVVGEAESYDEAVSGILRTRPDVAILDISLAEGSGIDVLAAARRALPALRGIMLTNYSSPQHMKASADAGAEYFLDKSVDFERIGEILRHMQSQEGANDRCDDRSD